MRLASGGQGGAGLRSTEGSLDLQGSLYFKAAITGSNLFDKVQERYTPRVGTPNSDVGFLSGKRVAMNTADQVRELCAKAATTEDPTELSEALSQLRAALHEHVEQLKAMVEERRRRLADNHDQNLNRLPKNE